MAHMQRLLGFLCLALFAGSGLAQDQVALQRLGYTVTEESRLTDTAMGSRTFEYSNPRGSSHVRLYDKEFPPPSRGVPSVAKESERHQLLFIMQVSVKEGRSPQDISALTPKLVAAAERAVRDNSAAVAGLGYLAAAGSGVSTTALQSAVLSYLHSFKPPTAPMGAQIPGMVFSDEYDGSPDRHQPLALGQPGWKVNASRGFHARLGISSLLVEVVAKIPLKRSTAQEAKPTSQSEPATSAAPTMRDPNANSPVIWTGQAGRFVVRWTEADISASLDGRKVFSTRAIAEHDAKENQPSAEYSRKFALLSVVGSMISYSDKAYCDCGGAHPISKARFSAVDLDHPGQPARLTDSFAEADVLRALLEDTLVRKATAGSAPPQTLAALSGASITSKDCSFSVGSDLPTRFAFHHVEGSQVAVRIALSHDVEACGGRMVQLGVLLPIPERLRKSLESAQAGSSGFLMKDAARISGGRVASLEWKAK